MKFTQDHLTQIQNLGNVLGIQAPEIISSFFNVYSALLVKGTSASDAYPKAWDQVLSGLEFLANECMEVSRTGIRRTA